MYCSLSGDKRAKQQSSEWALCWLQFTGVKKRICQSIGVAKCGIMAMHFPNDREETGRLVAAITRWAPLSNYLYLSIKHSTGLNETKQEDETKPGFVQEVLKVFFPFKWQKQETKQSIRNVWFNGCCQQTLLKWDLTPKLCFFNLCGRNYTLFKRCNNVHFKC